MCQPESTATSLHLRLQYYYTLHATYTTCDVPCCYFLNLFFFFFQIFRRLSSFETRILGQEAPPLTGPLLPSLTAVLKERCFNESQNLSATLRVVHVS